MKWLFRRLHFVQFSCLVRHCLQLPAGAQNQPEGSTIYMQERCFACHGEYGFGGAGPTFRNDRFLGLTDYVVGQILLGRDIMPPFGDKLDDQQVAAVATYIRNSWGNHFGKVEAQQVAAVRKEVAGQAAGEQQQQPPIAPTTTPSDTTGQPR